VSGVQLVPAAQAPLLARPYYARGDPGAIVAALAHVPEVLEVAMPFIDTVLGPSSLDARTKEIVILRTSARLGCRFCVQTHTLAALKAGLSSDEVRALRGAAPLTPAFRDPGELALLDWVDAVALGLVGATVMLNRFCTALELPTAPGVVARLAAEGLA
jgi:AhpD family alkylhydroperoxidase